MLLLLGSPAGLFFRDFYIEPDTQKFDDLIVGSSKGIGRLNLFG